jgi:hypothetical protein
VLCLFGEAASYEKSGDSPQDENRECQENLGKKKATLETAKRIETSMRHRPRAIYPQADPRHRKGHAYYRPRQIKGSGYPWLIGYVRPNVKGKQLQRQGESDRDATEFHEFTKVQERKFDGLDGGRLDRQLLVFRLDISFPRSSGYLCRF